MTDRSKRNTSTGRSTEKNPEPLLGSLLSREIARKLIDRSLRDLCLADEAEKALEFFVSDDLNKHCVDAGVDADWVRKSALEMAKHSKIQRQYLLKGILKKLKGSRWGSSKRS